MQEIMAIKDILKTRRTWEVGYQIEWMRAQVRRTSSFLAIERVELKENAVLKLKFQSRCGDLAMAMICRNPTRP
jgi:hypothetical protein